MELKELESKIQALLKNENIRVWFKEDVFYIDLYDSTIYKIIFDSFTLVGYGVEQKYWTVFSDNSLLLQHKEIIETCLLIDDDVEKQLKALIKEYIQ